MLGKMNTRASVHDVTRVIKSGGVPKQITQQPADCDPGHYQRLCNLGGSQPDAIDLVDYVLDMKYMELQPELLRYLTPVLLTAWRQDLFEGSTAKYGGFVEQFWPALLEGSALTKVYSKVERNAFTAYLRNSILDRLDAEESLHFSGMEASPYDWVQALVSYGTLFPDVEILWTEWWQMKTPGHAVAAFQYASALMYDDTKNPVFDSWTPDKGGGPPALWDCGAMMFGVGWKKKNLAFLKGTLSVGYFEQKLQFAFRQIQNSVTRKIASGILDDFPGKRTRLELRIEQLPNLLMDVSQVGGFTI
jgi:hypothetical protein